jgi:hypothetical protein
MKLDEIAWVVDDIDEAIRTRVQLGLGPFFRFDLEAPEARYRGERTPLSLKLAVSRSADVQIELIQQVNEGPSVFRDVFPKGQGGFHHIRRQAGDYDQVVSSLLAHDVEIVAEMAFGSQRICFADTRRMIGCMLEVYDPSDAVEALKRITSEAIANWDGTNPVRLLSLADLT